MTCSRTIRGALALVLISLGLAGSSTANNEAFKIAVNPRNPVSAVDRDFLRAAFLKQTITWHHGPTIRPIGLAGDSRVRDRFTREVMKKTPSQLKSYWLQRIFSGTDLPPLEVDTPGAVIAYVLANPGGLAYLPIDVDPGGAKIIKIR